MKNNDWTGGYNSVFKCLGAVGHSNGRREQHDYYATDPIVLNYLLENGLLPHNIWECSCGEGHLSKRLVENGYNVCSTDLIDRGYGLSGIDFLKTEEVPFKGSEPMCILTNPPYKFANEFILHALKLIKPNDKVFMFLKTTFLEGKKRKEILFDKYPPKRIYQFSGRIVCAKNGKFERMRKIGSAVAYAWYEWEVGSYGTTTLKWI